MGASILAQLQSPFGLLVMRQYRLNLRLHDLCLGLLVDLHTYLVAL
jgi:hypothetical protein